MEGGWRTSKWHRAARRRSPQGRGSGPAPVGCSAESKPPATVGGR